MERPDQTPGRELTRKQFDEVIRRAAELAALDSESGNELKERDLFRIAQDVGLPEHHVRRALSEVRAGATPRGFLDRWYGPTQVVASRVVPGSGAELADRLDEFLVGGQLLQRVRRSEDYLLYRPSVDWISTLARAASSTSRRYYVASAKSVEIHIQEVDEGRTLVEIIVDPGIRGDWISGGLVGGGSGGLVAGTATGLGLATVTPEAMAVAGGLAVFGGILAVVNRLTARGHRRKLVEVQAEVEGILDRLEAEDSLEPPPASWRRWVERQFHGARRLLDDRDA
jgi:hypothetical protein